MRGAHGALHSTRWLRMLWGQNVAHAYTPPRPALAGLIAGLPLHRYYYDYNNNNSNNNRTKRTHTGRAVQDIQDVAQHTCQAHAATQHTPSSTHHTTSTCIGTTSSGGSNSNDRKEEDVRCVERVCTSALLPSRAAEMTLCDASEGVPLLAVTPCDAADVQQALCLLHRRAHTRPAQTHTTNTITASASAGEGNVCDVAAAYDTLAALHTTVHTHRTLLAGAESLQTGVPLRFTKAALSAALQYTEQALHTLSTYTNTNNDDGSIRSSSSTQEACRAEAAPAVHARQNNNKRKKKAGAGEDADRHNDSDTATTGASIAAAAAATAAATTTTRILQQDCQALRKGLQHKHHLHPSSSHTSYPALSLTPTTFSLAYALQATAAALLTPGCGDVLWLPSADAALSALWLMHLLTHPAYSTHTSHSTHTSNSDDEMSAVRKAGVWGAAGRFHVLLTGSHSLHVLPGLTSFSYYTSSSSSSQLLSSQLVQSVREGDHVEGSGTEPTRRDASCSARSVAAHMQSDATHTTTTGATAASSSSSSAMQPAAPHTPPVPLLLLVLLYGLTSAAAQALHTELQRKMQQQQQQRHEIHCAKSADDCPALPSSWRWLTLRPACPSFVVCHTARASTPSSAAHRKDRSGTATAAAAGEDTPYVACDGLVKTTTNTTTQGEDEEEKTVCAAMALWLYRHAFTPCHTMSGTPTTAAATAETVKAEMHTGERAGDMAKASPEKKERAEDVLCVHLSPLPALCGVSCVRLTRQTHTAAAAADKDNNKEHTITCSHTTLITPPSSSLLLRTSLAFIPQSQLRHVLREMVRLYGASSASAATATHVGHISHSLDMGAAIGPLRSAAHAEAVRRCIAAAVKGQPNDNNDEEEEKEEEEGVRRTRAAAAATERQGRHSAPHTCNATSSAAASHGSSRSNNSSYTTRKTTGSSNNSGDTSQHVQQQPQGEHGTHSYISTTTRAMAVQPVRWQKVCGGFPLSMTAAGPAALYLTPCLLCTSLSSLITATTTSSSFTSTHIHTLTTSSSCPLSTTARGSDDDMVSRAEADGMQRAVAEAVGRLCHSVHALTRELERDYDGTVPSVLFVCGYEESTGRWVQRACEQYAQQQQQRV